VVKQRFKSIFGRFVRLCVVEQDVGSICAIELTDKLFLLAPYPPS
jgi:hypothetical protein